MKYKVGDKVIVISADTAEKRFDAWLVNNYKMIWGRVFRINYLINPSLDNQYYLIYQENIGNCSLTDDMIEGYANDISLSKQNNNQKGITQQNGQYVINW